MNHLYSMSVFLLISNYIRGASIEPTNDQVKGHSTFEDAHKVSSYLASIQLRMNNSNDTLHFGWYHLCSGTIIGERRVLASSGCLLKDKHSHELYMPSQINVVVGTTHRFLRTNQTRIVDVVGMKRKPCIRIARLRICLTILELSNSVLSCPTAAVLRLADRSPGSGEKCIVAGWDPYFRNGPTSAFIVYTEIKIFDRDYCRKIHGDNFKNEVLCAGNDDDLESVYYGDNGGPMICNGTLSGIVPCGSRCDVEELKGLFLDLSHYKVRMESCGVRLHVHPTVVIIILIKFLT